MSYKSQNGYFQKSAVARILLVFGIAIAAFGSTALAQSSQAKPKGVLSENGFRNTTLGCNKLNDPSACYLLARHYRAIAQNKGQNDERRRYFLSLACNKQPRADAKFKNDRFFVGESCQQAGRMLMNGKGGSKNLSLSTQYFERACGFDNMFGCAYLGEAYETGRGIPANNISALAAYEKSCSDRLPISCYRSTKMIFRKAVSVKNAPDNSQFALARRQSKITCEQKWQAQASGCWYHAILMEEARGGPADKAAALAAYNFACANSKLENGLNACYQAALISLEGPLNLRNKAMGKRLLTTSCTAKYKPSCDRLKKGI